MWPHWCSNSLSAVKENILLSVQHLVVSLYQYSNWYQWYFFFYTSGTNLSFWKQTSNQMVVMYKSADICDTNIILTSSHFVLDIREVVFLFNEFGVSFQPSFVNYCVFTIYHRLMCTGKKTKIILSETKLYKGNSIWGILEIFFMTSCSIVFLVINY